MNPLAITVSPALPMDIGERNLKSFIRSGYNLISINPSYEAMKKLHSMDLLNWVLLRLANSNTVLYCKNGK